MAFKIVLRGEEPSGRILALLCARTGETIDVVRRSLQSSPGLALKEGLTREKAEELLASLPADGSVNISIQRDIDSWTAVLMGYRPGSRGRLRVALQKMSRLTTEEVIHFLANIPIALKAGISRRTADSIKDVLEREGGIVEIRPFTGSSLAPLETGPQELPSEPAPEKPKREPVEGEPPGRLPDIPPLVEETAANFKPVMNVKPPQVVKFDPPLKEAVSAPPIPEGEKGLSFVFPEPYRIKFTIPALPVPALLSSDGASSSPPNSSPMGRVVPLYLHPVSFEQRDRVSRAISETLGLSTNRCRELVERAPVAIWACRERLNALVTLRVLSEKGVPVSLIPAVAGSNNSDSKRSFFGWMNGNQ